MLCGKQIYRNRTEAVEAIGGMHKKIRGANNKPHYSYWCDACGGWHVASKIKGKMRRGKRNGLTKKDRGEGEDWRAR